MDAATQNKNERINLRMKSSSKRLIERAASFEGKTVSHFILKPKGSARPITGWDMSRAELRNYRKQRK